MSSLLACTFFLYTGFFAAALRMDAQPCPPYPYGLQHCPRPPSLISRVRFQAELAVADSVFRYNAAALEIRFAELLRDIDEASRVNAVFTSTHDQADQAPANILNRTDDQADSVATLSEAPERSGSNADPPTRERTVSVERTRSEGERTVSVERTSSRSASPVDTPANPFSVPIPRSSKASTPTKIVTPTSPAAPKLETPLEVVSCIKVPSPLEVTSLSYTDGEFLPIDWSPHPISPKGDGFTHIPVVATRKLTFKAKFARSYRKRARIKS